MVVGVNGWFLKQRPGNPSLISTNWYNYLFHTVLFFPRVYVVILNIDLQEFI